MLSFTTELLVYCCISTSMRSSHPLPKSIKCGLPFLTHFSATLYCPPTDWANKEHTVPCLQTAVKTTSFPLDEQIQHPLWHDVSLFKCMKMRWKTNARVKNIPEDISMFITVRGGSRAIQWQHPGNAWTCHLLKPCSCFQWNHKDTWSRPRRTSPWPGLNRNGIRLAGNKSTKCSRRKPS